MDASVLVVGNTQFLNAFVCQMRELVSGSVDQSSQTEEVISLIKSKQPDILILQANFLENCQFSVQIQERNRLSWTYCIAVKNYSESIDEDISLEHSWQLTASAQALERGADAYLQLNMKMNQAEIRLLKAQIHAGLRGVYFHQEQMRTNHLLSAMALADPLTELSNRRAMEWELPRQIKMAHHRDSSLSLILVDVDYFKSINDTYGHQVGDRVLQLLATRLQHNLRVKDTVFRYGGEEFVVLLSQTDLREACIVARRLLKVVSEQPFNIDGKLLLNLTISLGIASLTNTDDCTGESLLRRADYNLLSAKRNGRNQVCHF